MSQTWQLLRPDQSETPSISISDREDVMKISNWSAIRVKAEKFEEVDFDNLVTEENLRQFLGYNIPRDKKTITKRGAVDVSQILCIWTPQFSLVKHLVLLFSNVLCEF